MVNNTRIHIRKIKKQLHIESIRNQKLKKKKLKSWFVMWHSQHVYMSRSKPDVSGTDGRSGWSTASRTKESLSVPAELIVVLSLNFSTPGVWNDIFAQHKFAWSSSCLEGSSITLALNNFLFVCLRTLYPPPSGDLTWRCDFLMNEKKCWPSFRLQSKN